MIKTILKLIVSLIVFGAIAENAHAQATCPNGSLAINQSLSEIAKCGTAGTARGNISAAKSGVNSDITQLLGLTSALSPAEGGTGVNNGTSTITLGGPLTTNGAYSVTFNFTGATNVTFPTSGTLATVGGGGTYANAPVINNVTSITSLTTPLTPQQGGTGIANSNAATLTLGNATAITGGYTVNLIDTANTTLTLPTSGTLLSSASLPWSPANGGTGVNNGTYTITLGGNFITNGFFNTTGSVSIVGNFSTNNPFSTTGAGTLALNTTGNTNVTLPTSGTLLSSTSLPWSPSNGGTGVANSNANTITLSGPISTSGAFSTAGGYGITLNASALTNVSLPTSGTLTTNSQLGNLANIASVTGPGTSTAPNTLVEMSGSTNYTYTLVSPPSSSSPLYLSQYKLVNNSSVAQTIATPSGVFSGANAACGTLAGTTLSIPANTTYELTDDGTNWVCTGATSTGGGSGPTLPLSAANGGTGVANSATITNTAAINNSATLTNSGTFANSAAFSNSAPFSNSLATIGGGITNAGIINVSTGSQLNLNPGQILCGDIGGPECTISAYNGTPGSVAASAQFSFLSSGAHTGNQLFVNFIDNNSLAPGPFIDYLDVESSGVYIMPQQFNTGTLATVAQISGVANSLLLGTGTTSPYSLIVPNQFVEFTGSTSGFQLNLNDPTSWPTGSYAPETTYELWNNSTQSVTIYAPGGGFGGVTNTCGAPGGTSITLPAGNTCYLIVQSGKYISFAGNQTGGGSGPALPLVPSNGGTGVSNISADTISLGGPVTTAGALTTAGANSLTLTTTGSTNVTLPTSGTLLSTASLPISPANGGTGVSNSSTITLGGALTTAGANSLTLTTTGSTNVTVPTTGTLLSTAIASALANGTTATTQTTGDSSNEVATDAFVIANAGGGISLPLSAANGGTGHSNSGTIILPSGTGLISSASNFESYWGSGANSIIFQGTGAFQIDQNGSGALVNEPIQFPSSQDYLQTTSQAGGIAYVYVKDTASGSFTIANPNAFIEMTGTSGTTTVTLKNPNSWGTVSSNSNSSGNVAITYQFWNNSTVSVTVSTSGSGFIGPSGTCGAAGGTSFTLAAGATCSLIDDGTHYVSIRN